MTEKLRHGGAGRFGNSCVQWIAQNQLNSCLISGEAEDFSLVGRYQQINDLCLLGLAFSVFFDIGAGGKNLDILQQRLDGWAGLYNPRPAGRL